MTVRPFRLPFDHEAGGPGRLIDRSRPLSFTFDAIAYSGFKGDTLASALLANGVRLVGRSPKFHRPRSFVSAGAEEPNGLVALGTGGRMSPNERATAIELHDGLVARSQNRWPNLAFDAGQVLAGLPRLLPAGFQNKALMWPRWAWPFYERVIRRAAPGGPAPGHRDRDRYEHLHAACDVLVAGGGVAGIAAALAAMDTGARVIIADGAPRFGGISDLFDGTIDGAPALDWIRSGVRRLAASERVHMLTRTTVAGIYEDTLALLDQRAGERHRPGDAGPDAPRQRLWKVRAREIIVAAGALERPLTFADNDRPGVMLGSAVRAYGLRFAVAPGAAGIVFTNNDDGYRTARALHDLELAVARIVDIRDAPQGPLVEAARQRGIEIAAGHGIVGVETCFGGTEMRAVRIAPLGGAGANAVTERIACDFVCNCGGWDPQAHLTAHRGGRLEWDDAISSLKPGILGPHMQAAGAANGVFTLGGCLREGYAAGERAARRSRGERPGHGARRAGERVVEPAERPLRALWQVVAPHAGAGGERQFVDQASDVTAADIALAVREGYGKAEHLKRYAALGMAPDQGKTGSVNALAVHAAALGVAISEIGTTTFRPPYLPVTFGAMAGERTGDLFRPVRRTPVWHWHRNNGASFETVGLWRRPFAYTAGHAARERAVAGEVRAVRQGVGLLDASTLAKFELFGPDAAILLDRLFATDMASLGVGRCRYGLMLDEQGFVIDDGVVARLAVEHFWVNTTTGRAEETRQWFERWHQSEWPQLRVFITDVTEQWAQFLVAGPRSRAVLEAVGGLNVTRAALPVGAAGEGTLAGVPVRVLRTGFAGELAYDIAAPANSASALWDAISEAGAPHTIAAFGTGALDVMRLEAGHIAIGEETDGTVTPFDLGLGRLVAGDKGDFIGRSGLQRSALQRSDRRQLVGLAGEDDGPVLPQGGYLIEVADRNAEPPHRMIGHVTSSCRSPTLGRPIALALVARGRERIGDAIVCPVGRAMVTVTITGTVFDERGRERIDG